jgi:predicted dehydrogenase
MYVTGDGTPGFGTVLTALAEHHRRQPFSEIVVTAAHDASEKKVQRALLGIQDHLHVNLPARFERASGLLVPRGPFDAAVVSVPDHLHTQLTLPLLEQGIHCLVVKPLTQSLAEADRLTRVAAQRGVLGMVEFHKRWDESNLLARKAIANGSLGDLVCLQVEYSQKRDIPLRHFRAWAHQTNIFQYLGVHYVDLVYFLTGMTPLRVAAVGTHGVLASLGVDTFDSVHAMVEWEQAKPAPRKMMSTFSIGWVDPSSTTAMSDQRFVLSGSRGRLLADQKHRGLELVTDVNGAQVPNPYFSDLLPGPDGELHAWGYGIRSIQQFLLDVEEVRAGRTAPASLDATRPSFRQARISTAVIEAANESLAQQGAWKDVHVVA